VFGELKIISSFDIGDLGPKVCTPITYYWNPVYNVIGVLPWLVLFGAFILLKENRHWQALWILLPVVVFRMLWVGFAALVNIPSSVSSSFVFVIDCLLIGFVLNWLLAERIGNRNRFVTWLLALLVFVLAFGVMLVNLGMGIDAVQFSIFIGLTVGILLVSFVLTGLMCRKKFGPVRFSIWMAVWVLLLTIAFFMVFALIQAMITHYPLMTLLLQVLMAGLVYAWVLIAALLPFEIVLFVSRFWRKRFEAVFGLKSKAATVESSVQMSEQSESEKPVAE
jgi:hypothetical protein